jgi:hypothetical protein
MRLDPVTERCVAVHDQDGADAQAEEDNIEHGRFPWKIGRTLRPERIKKTFVIRQMT